MGIQCILVYHVHYNTGVCVCSGLHLSLVVLAPIQGEYMRGALSLSETRHFSRESSNRSVFDTHSLSLLHTDTIKTVRSVFGIRLRPYSRTAESEMYVFKDQPNHGVAAHSLNVVKPETQLMCHYVNWPLHLFEKKSSSRYKHWKGV